MQLAANVALTCGVSSSLKCTMSSLSTLETWKQHTFHNSSMVVRV